MRNPISHVPQNVRMPLLGIAATMALLFGSAVLLSPATQDNDNPPRTPATPHTTSEQPSATLVNNSIPPSQAALADAETMAEDAVDLAAATATLALPPTESIPEDSNAIELQSTQPISDPATENPGSDSQTENLIDNMLVASLNEENLTQIASSSDPDVRRLSALVNLVESLKTELGQTKEQLQTLQVKFNEQYQLARQKANETERWRQEAKEFETTMNKIIEDNNRDSDMLSRELERWRERALQAERDNARLSSRRPTPTTTALQRLPETNNPAPAVQQPVPQPLPQRSTTQSPPQQTPTTNFTTTCYDPNQGYFTCTVRQ